MTDNTSPAIMEEEGLYSVYHTGLNIAPSMPFLVWEGLGNHLVVLQDALPFLIGDWLNFGELEFGEDAAQAYQEHWQRKEATLRKYQWVCGKVHRDLRMKMASEFDAHALTFSHYEAVSSFKADVQEALLRESASNEWSVRSLKAAVRDYKAAEKANGTELIIPASTTLRLTPGPDYDPEELAVDVVTALHNMETELEEGQVVTNVEVIVRISYEKVV